jgi:hypothetical protein
MPSFETHREYLAEHPDGVKYRVRIGPTGVPRYNPMGGGINSTRILIGRLRYIIHRSTAWTVEVVPASAWRVFYNPVLEEDHPDRASAASRAAEVVEGIVTGDLDWDGPWKKRPHADT